MNIKKASPGLDPRNRLSQLLGEGFTVEDYDGGRPLSAQVGDAEVLLIRDVPVSGEVIDAAPNLRLIQRPGDHIRGVDVVHAARRAVFVSRIPAHVQGGAARDVAELALSLVFALAKQHRRARNSIRDRTVGLPKTLRIEGKTLCLVGVGNTGTELAKLARGVGLHVIAVKRTRDESLRETLKLEALELLNALHAQLARADFVSLHLPVTPETVGVIGPAEFAAMKQGAVLINISRAPLIDRTALLEALRTGKLGGVGLDVYWEEPPDPSDPLFQFDNVLATPHIAGETLEMEERLYGIVAANILALAKGGQPDYLVAPGDPEGDNTAFKDIDTHAENK